MAHETARQAVFFVADLVCPWCYVGWRTLLAALSAPGPEAAIVWRAFQLDPDTPPEGRDRAEHLKLKYPGQQERLRAMAGALEEAAREAGLVLPGLSEPSGPGAPRLGPQRQVNSMNAHRLVRWSRSPGVQPQMIELLFRAYHVEGLDISSPAVLAAAAGELGMDAGLVLDLLAGEADKDAVRAETLLAQRLGLPGAPAYLMTQGSGAEAEPLPPAALVGAQSASAIRAFIDKHAES